LALTAAAVGLTAAGQPARAPVEPVTWKPVVNCVLRVDDRPAKLWEVYVVPKKKDHILIQLGTRFLQLDTGAKTIHEVAPEALERKGPDLVQTADDSKPKRELLPSAEWTERDAGRARIIRLRLTAEGRRLEVQLPIAPDLRKLY
jgi:hypothetical protein